MRKCCSNILISFIIFYFVLLYDEYMVIRRLKSIFKIQQTYRNEKIYILKEFIVSRNLVYFSN